MIISDWKSFADATIQTHDLDPTYDILAAVRKSRGEAYTSRACLYMLMFYDLRGALRAAEFKGKKFWEYIRANYPDLPRGSERRHFRGQNGLNCINSLQEKWELDPQDYLPSVYAPDLPNLSRRLSMTPSFGPYMIWKAADYYDRILGMPVDFTHYLKHVPEQPSEAAAIFWENQPLSGVMQKVADYIKAWDAPGLATRKCGFPEAETVLCMMKGFFHTKHNQIGDDIRLRHRQLSNTEWAKFLPPLPTETYERGQYVHI